MTTVGRVITGFILLAMMFVVVLFCLAAKGGKADFSPDTLQCRSRSEYLLYGTELPLFWSPYKYWEHDLAKLLVREGLWKPNSTPTPRWISYFHWNVQWKDGYGTAYSFLARRHDWIAWTERYPEKAAVLWPKVLAELRQGRNSEAEMLLDEAWWEESKN